MASAADTRAAAALFQARLKPGTRVQARYDDGSGKLQWYDAVVVVGSATNGSDVRVKWMGYGTVDAVSAASVRPPPPLPAGWLESTDEESGFPYYENATTGETTWARPAPPRRPALPKRAVVPHLRAAAAVVGGVRAGAAASPYAGAAATAPRVGARAVVTSPEPVATVGGFASKKNRRAITSAAANSPVAIVGGFASKANRQAIRRSRALTSNMTPEQIAAMVDAARSNGFAGGCGGCDCGVAGC